MLAGSVEMPESPMSEVPPVLRTSLSETASWTLRLLTWTGHAGWVGGDAGVSHVGGAASLEYQFLKDRFPDSKSSLTWTGHAGWVRGDAGVSHLGGATGLEYQFLKDRFPHSKSSLTWTGHAGWVRGDAGVSHVGGATGLEYQFLQHHRCYSHARDLKRVKYIEVVKYRYSGICSSSVNGCLIGYNDLDFF
jgi:hypothetical protein